MKSEENYYELLKVHPKSSIAEIVAAYHSARNAFSKDSLAAYSLFTAEEAQDVLKRLEEAYFTLSNIDRKRDYDRRLQNPADTTLPPKPAPVMSAPAPSPAPVSTPAAEAPAPAPVAPTGPVVDGGWLASTRESRGLTVEDVSRLTKIPSKVIKAIETNDLSRLPARVYLQGFVTNLAKTYRLDPVPTTKAYLQNLDRLLAPSNG